MCIVSTDKTVHVIACMDAQHDLAVFKATNIATQYGAAIYVASFIDILQVKFISNVMFMLHHVCYNDNFKKPSSFML